jgi:hypothetical protein
VGSQPVAPVYSFDLQRDRINEPYGVKGVFVNLLHTELLAPVATGSLKKKHELLNV